MAGARASIVDYMKLCVEDGRATRWKMPSSPPPLSYLSNSVPSNQGEE